jgi:predicted TIM-barrel fold metal-dependent hydrolase
MERSVMEITDSQVHIWQAECPERPWPSGGHVPDWAFRPYGAEALVADMDKAGVTRALLIPPAFDGGQNDYSLEAAKRFPGRFGVVGRLPLGDPSARELMQAWAEQEHGYGLRFAFFLPEQKALLANGSIDWLWPEAQRLGIPLMVYPTHEFLGYFGDLAKTFGGLRLTIDHLAVGHTVADKDDNAFPHMKALIALSALPNVAVKASALPDYSTEPYPYRNLHAYLEAIINAFGPERVFWGTDLTRLVCSYGQAVTMFTEEMAWLNRSELELIMDRGVRDWHGWKLDGDQA